MSESQLQSDGIRAASKAAAASTRRNIPKSVTLSNGIVLKIKPMPPLLLNSVANSIPEVEVPKVFIEDKGRDEENPNHPAYIRAVQERNVKLSLATNNLILYACTELENVPEGVYAPQDDGWLLLAQMANIQFDVNDPVQRYLAWLKCYAISTTDDMEKTISIPLMLAGITESEVQDVVDTFRSPEVWGTDSELSSEQPSTNGNHVQETPPRSRSRARGA